MFFSDYRVCFYVRATVRLAFISYCLELASEVGRIRLLHRTFRGRILRHSVFLAHIKDCFACVSMCLPPSLFLLVALRIDLSSNLRRIPL